MFKKEIYQARRNQLTSMVNSGLILLPANSESPFSGLDSHFPFRQDSTFLYFAGLDKPDLALVIDLDDGTETLYGGSTPEDSIFWTGPTPSLADVSQKSGIGQHAALEKLPQTLEKAQKEGRRIHFLPPYQTQVALKLFQLLQIAPQSQRQAASSDLIQAVIRLRSVKDSHEIREIEAAVEIAHKMHTTAMIMAMPGASEREIRGVIEGLALSYGKASSFQPIITIRGDILHNPSYTNTLENGKLLIVDAGAESPLHYASDITRTIPVGRSFSRQQRSIYEIVLKTNLSAIEASRPETPFLTVHLEAALTITRGLKDLGIMKGDPEEAVQAGAHALFFPHGLGHMLGLDVHDMGALGEDAVGYDADFTRSTQFGLRYLRLAKPLKTGNVITIEPGIYFIPPLIDAWKAEKRFDSFIDYKQVDLYVGLGGVRIEDDVLITATGSQVLGKAIPKTIREIESF